MYRHAGDSQLVAMLSSLKLNECDVKDILALAKGPTGGHFQLACQRHFDLTHPDYFAIIADAGSTDAAAGNGAVGGAVANHPNAWFIASVQYHRVKATNSGQTSSQGSAIKQAFVSSLALASPVTTAHSGVTTTPMYNIPAYHATGDDSVKRPSEGDDINYSDFLIDSQHLAAEEVRDYRDDMEVLLSTEE